MEKIFLTYSQLKRMIKDKKMLERELNVNISSERNLVKISGSPLEEYDALQVFRAIGLNFGIAASLLLKDPEYMLQTIPIKDYTKKSPGRLIQVKARIIGKQGRVLKNISQLTDCALRLSNNTVAILGGANDVKTAASAILSLIKGSRHSNVYARLERAEHEEGDLGLKLNSKDREH